MQAASDMPRVRRGVRLSPLFEHLADASGIESGLQALSDAHGKLFYGGFRRISSKGLVVISSVPSELVGSSLEGIRNQLLVYLSVIFVLLLAGRHLHLLRKTPSPSKTQASQSVSQTGSVKSPAPAEAAVEVEVETQPRKAAFVALHGSLRGFNQLLDAGGPVEATEALNDFFATAAAVVRASGGHFECYTGASFGAAWEIGEADAASGARAVSKALSCALGLRAEMDRLNESRKVDGKKPLKQGIGIHVGQALAARLGAVPDLKSSVTGEALACARALDRLALAEGKDLVMSQDLLKAARGIFTGKSLGEARLTSDTGLTPYFSVVGFREELSMPEALVEPGTFGGQEPGAAAEGERATGGETRLRIVRPESAPSRWLVNNGSQIVGPFTAQEISQRLFTQELDFECECWNEETGIASHLETAGIFSGSRDAGACYWVFDGGMVHGPVSEGFIRTALQHGAISAKAHICDRSTVAGWKTAAEFLAEFAPAATDRKPGTDSGTAAA